MLPSIYEEAALAAIEKSKEQTAIVARIYLASY
jgi:hypothetical protein